MSTVQLLKRSRDNEADCLVKCPLSLDQAERGTPFSHCCVNLFLSCFLLLFLLLLS